MAVKKKTSKSLIKKKKINWKFALPIVLVIVLAGTYVVYRSYASSISFGKTPQQMVGGNLRQSGGVYRRNVSPIVGPTLVTVSAENIKSSKSICATAVINANTETNLYMEQVYAGGKQLLAATGGKKSGQRVPLCADTKYFKKLNSTLIIGVQQRTSAPNSTSAGILSVYGIKNTFTW